MIELKSQSHPCDMEQLVRLHFPMVYSTCFRITRDRHDAEDAAQVAFLALAADISAKREIRAPGPWLRQVATRAAIDICRRRKRRSAHESASSIDFAAPGASDPSQAADFAEIRPLLLSSLNKLPTKYRLPLILHYFGGLSHAELSKELACTRITLRVRMHRGHNMLRASLKEHGVDLTGGLLGLALSAAVQWQVSHSLVGGAVSAGLSTAPYGMPACIASPDLFASACCAAGHRFTTIKIALIISAIAGAGLAAGAPLLAKLREWQEFPILPSIQDLSPSFAPTFTAPVPSFSNAGSTPAAKPTLAAPIRPHDGEYAYAPASQSAYIHASPLVASISPPMTPRSAPRVAPSHSGQLPWVAPVDGTPQIATGSVHAQPPARIVSATEAQQPQNFQTRAARPRFARVTPPPGPQVNEIWNVITVPSASNSVWQDLQYASATEISGSGASVIVLPIGTSASVQSYSVEWVGERAQLNRIMADHYALSMTVATPVVVRRVIDNNGQIIARNTRISYGDTDIIRNTVENTGVNGWFAAQKGEISLPPIRLTSGEQWHNWGEDESDTSIDLINSMRIGLTATRDDSLSISLLAADHPAVPALPAGHHFVGIWKATGGASIIGDIDLTVRYDDTLLAAKGLDEQFIKLWYFRDGQWQRAIDAFGRDTDLNHVYGHVPASGFFGVSTPEPSSAAIAIIAGAAGLLRRSRRRK